MNMYQQFVAIGNRCELFHEKREVMATGSLYELYHEKREDGRPFAVIEHRNGHREILLIKSRQFKDWLIDACYEETGRAVSTGLGKAIATLTTTAIHDRPGEIIHRRLAEDAGNTYLNLYDAQGRAAKITTGAWEIITDPPVRFFHPGALPLPVPARGGSIHELRQLSNVKDDSAFERIIAWLTAALRPTGPYPVLWLHGVPGSGKSIMAKMLKDLIDPHRGTFCQKLNTMKQAEHDAWVNWVSVYDFVHRLGQKKSDNFSHLAETRPVILAGIDEPSANADLMRQCLVLTLPRIKRYRGESDLEAALCEARPRILGALLDAVALTLGTPQMARGN